MGCNYAFCACSQPTKIFHTRLSKFFNYLVFQSFFFLCLDSKVIRFYFSVDSCDLLIDILKRINLVLLISNIFVNILNLKPNDFSKKFQEILPTNSSACGCWAGSMFPPRSLYFLYKWASLAVSFWLSSSA